MDHNLINNRRMFNGATDDLAEKQYIPHKVYLNEFVANVLRDDMGSKKIQPPNGRFFKKNISNWDFNLEISHLRKKVFILTSKM